MFEVNRITSFASHGSQRAGDAWQRLNRQPSWVVKASALAFILVIGIPLLALGILALLAASVLFAVLWGFNALVSSVRGVFPKRDGRDNVRVIRRVDRP